MATVRVELSSGSYLTAICSPSVETTVNPVYTMQPVVQPVSQPVEQLVVLCKRGFIKQNTVDVDDVVSR